MGEPAPAGVRKPPLSVRLRRRAAGSTWNRLRRLLPRRYVRARSRRSWIYLNLSESAMMVERAFGVYEYWAMELARTLLLPGMTAIDAGANKGDYTLLFARLVGGGGRVLSFEPVAENRRWLERSVSANGYRGVEILPCALADTDGEAPFYPGRSSGWGSLDADREGVLAGGGWEVATARLDTVLRARRLESVDLLKIDVEGAELKVLRGARDLLANCARLRLIVALDSRLPEERVEIQRLLQQAGFRLQVIGPRMLPVTEPERSAGLIFAERASAGP